MREFPVRSTCCRAWPPAGRHAAPQGLRYPLICFFLNRINDLAKNAIPLMLLGFFKMRGYLSLKGAAVRHQDNRLWRRESHFGNESQETVNIFHLWPEFAEVIRSLSRS